MTLAYRISGFVSAEDTTDAGYYYVWPSIDAGRRVLYGWSIRGTALSPAQRVGIVQCGRLGHTDEYGFFDRSDAGLRCAFEASDWSAGAIRKLNPAGAAMNWLCQKAKNFHIRYEPGTATAVSADRITVRLRWKQTTVKLPVASAVSITDFVVGDEVLVGHYPGGIDQIEGWWQARAGGVYAYTDTVAFTAPASPTIEFGPYKSRRRYEIDTIVIEYNALVGPHFATMNGTTWAMFYSGLISGYYRYTSNTPVTSSITVERNRTASYPVTTTLAPIFSGRAYAGGFYR